MDVWILTRQENLSSLISSFFFLPQVRNVSSSTLSSLTLFQVTDNKATPQCSAAACISTIKTHQTGTHTNTHTHKHTSPGSTWMHTHKYSVHSESSFHLHNRSIVTQQKTNMAYCSNMHTHIQTWTIKHAHDASRFSYSTNDVEYNCMSISDYGKYHCSM